ncbi:helix-turn-helix domain-containing protein [Limosilactobacillus vaginalis]|uniref:helix-turn-helix domain-containing protein n=1 Tax=Limosilactobacillus vaginalis TaxID=1633 RepID=UPI0025A469C4|nr:helix-turn-helix transcriptional regulator [Limosilactobacillus vaginalis]MDM8259576.1 helix-turn-helix transcriptional regulator [Limosilactobacillus vaginalis]
MANSATNLSEGIKRLRKELKMTQSEFGKLFTPPATKGIVSKWENGKSVPSNERLERLSEITGLSVENLIFGSLKGSLAALLRRLFDFWEVLAKEDSNENWDVDEYLKQHGIEGKQSITNALELVTTIQNDTYVEKPARLVEIDNLIRESNKSDFYLSKEDAKLEEDYILSNFRAGLKYCGQDTLKKAKEFGVEPNQQDILLSMLLDSSKQHIVDVRVDNSDIISYSLRGIDSLMEYIQAHLSGFEYHGHDIKGLPKNVSRDLIMDLDDILNKAKTEISGLSKKY